MNIVTYRGRLWRDNEHSDIPRQAVERGNEHRHTDASCGEAMNIVTYRGRLWREAMNIVTYRGRLWRDNEHSDIPRQAVERQ